MGDYFGRSTYSNIVMDLMAGEKEAELAQRRKGTGFEEDFG